jgi:hypothetical protein
MRLINCTTLKLEEFFGDNIPPYAILSHTWGREEVTFADLPLGQRKTRARAGYRKVTFTCKQAIRDGLNYAWIDTCCIDKSSSAELSEAINSMFAWYKDSQRCYAYLSDVSAAHMILDFPASRWFTRGWTLQELLAPRDLIFYDREGIELGTRYKNAEWISTITRIDSDALSGERETPNRLGSFCAAKRMSWASDRQTTRAEDMAYCLLGLFDVQMPLLYGDDSIFAWGLKPEMDHPLGLVPDTLKKEMHEMESGVLLSSLLASSPKDFVNCAMLEYGANLTSPFTLTNIGLQIRLPVVPVFQPDDPLYSKAYRGWIGLLSCSTGSRSKFVGVLLLLGNANDESSTVATRARYRAGTFYYNTLVVGSRAASRSSLKTLTIARFDESGRKRGRYFSHPLSYRQIVVNESVALRDMGYHVKNGTGWNIAQSTWNPYNPTWNPKSMILTIEGRNIFRDLLEFCFEPSWTRQDTAFTVFMCTISSRAIAREGKFFSRDDKRGFYDHLEHNFLSDEMENVVIPDRQGKFFRVSVEIHASIVYSHRLYELNVDVVPVTAVELAGVASSSPQEQSLAEISPTNRENGQDGEDPRDGEADTTTPKEVMKGDEEDTTKKDEPRSADAQDDNDKDICDHADAEDDDGGQSKKDGTESVKDPVTEGPSKTQDQGVKGADNAGVSA